MEGYTILTGDYSQGGVSTNIYHSRSDWLKDINRIATVNSVDTDSKWITWIKYGDSEIGCTIYEVDYSRDVIPQIGLGDHIIGVPLTHKLVLDKVLKKLPEKYRSIQEVLQEIENEKSSKK